MSHRRDQKERLRAEREKREAEARAAAQRKRLVGVVAGAVLAVAAVVIVIVVAAGGGGGSKKGVHGSGDLFPSGGSIPKQKVFNLPKAAAAAGCQLTSNKAPSREHITDINQKVKYATNPPNSGKHYYVPADDGLYPGKPPKDVQLVQASSFLELRLTPERLTGEIVKFVERCFKPPRGRSSGRSRSTRSARRGAHRAS